MTLEIFETGAEDYGQFVKALICGAPGAGKTLISSTFPNPFFASAEGGLMSVASRRLKGAKIKKTDDLKELRGLLDQDPDVREQMFKRPIETLVVDTVDEIQRLFIAERLASKRLEALDQQSWGWLGEQMRAMLRGLRNLDMHVVFTCHLKETTDQSSGTVSVKPALQGAVGDEISQYMDLALLLRSETKTRVVGTTTERYEERYLQTYKDPQHDWIKDRSGQLPSEIRVNFEDDYARISKAIFSFMTDDWEKRTVETVGILQQIVEDNADSAVTPPVEEAPKAEVEVLAEAASARQVPAEVVVPEETPEDAPTEAPEPATVSDPAPPSPEPKPQPDEDHGPWKCEKCGDEITDIDQKELSEIMADKQILCRSDYREYMAQGKKR